MCHALVFSHYMADVTEYLDGLFFELRKLPFLIGFVFSLNASEFVFVYMCVRVFVGCN